MVEPNTLTNISSAFNIAVISLGRLNQSFLSLLSWLDRNVIQRLLSSEVSTQGIVTPMITSVTDKFFLLTSCIYFGSNMSFILCDQWAVDTICHNQWVNCLPCNRISVYVELMFFSNMAPIHSHNMRPKSAISVIFFCPALFPKFGYGNSESCPLTAGFSYSLHINDRRRGSMSQTIIFA